MELTAEIWKLFVDGEDESFRKLIFNHYTVLYDYGCKFTTDSELVKDAVQDLFLTLWNKRKSISQPENIKAYLFASLRRIIHKSLKVNQKIKENDEGFDKYFNFQVSVEAQFIKEETTITIAQRIALSIEKLPGRQKEVIFLKFYQGFTRNEIAQAMDITPQTVSNLLQIALNKMKNELGHSFDPGLLYLIVPLFFSFLKNL